jgi:uncharacterized protein YqgC (DUF456 family)
MSSSSSSGVGNHPVDIMYRRDNSIRKGMVATQDCCGRIGTEAKVGAVIGGFIGGVVCTAIPPFGAVTVPGIIVGSTIGAFIAKAIDNACKKGC